MTFPGRTRYQPVADHLAAITERQIILALEEIEALIDHPLPVSAFVSPDFWTAAKVLRSHLSEVRSGMLEYAYPLRFWGAIIPPHW